MPDLAHPGVDPEGDYYDDLLGYPIEPPEINDLKPNPKINKETKNALLALIGQK